MCYNLFMRKFLGILILALTLCNIGLAECVGDDCEEEETMMPAMPENALGTPGFDFVCFNSCKDRNNESMCMKHCTLQ